MGKYAVTDLMAGDYILASKISATPISSDIVLSHIPSGKVAISMTVKTLASGLSDKLLAGDIIRIYHFMDEARDIPELQFVKVLSAIITVLASPEQAKLITAMEDENTGES